jgi:hypothetical protein
MGRVKLQQGGVYTITTQGNTSTTPRSMTGTEEIFEKTFLEGINNTGSMKIGQYREPTGPSPAITSTDTFIAIDTVSTAKTIVLPTAAVAGVGRIFFIKKIGGTNTLTINPTSTTPIDGALTKATTDASASMQVYSSGDNTKGYYIISSYGTWT